MSTSKLMKVTYYDPKSQIRLLCYADTVVWDTKPTPTLTALRFGGYPERVQGLADAIYGGATIEIEDGMRVGQMEAFIVKGQYNCVSDTRSYKKPFIPVVTEYLLLFHKQDALFFPFAVRRETTVDLRKEDIPGLTWHHLIRLTMEELSGRAKLSDLGDRLAAHPKAKKNPHFRDRIRATAYEHPGQYISCGNGFYALNYAVA